MDKITIERETLRSTLDVLTEMPPSPGKALVVSALRAALAAQPAEPVGDVVVTRNDAGEIVAVTRQDDEGRILSVIAEAQPAPSHRAPSHRLSDARTGDIRLACHA